jgi:hypothetical protein
MMKQTQNSGLVARTLDNFFVSNPFPMKQLDGDNRLEIVAGDHLGQKDLPKRAFGKLFDNSESASWFHQTHF